ncbi:MAG: hypothetical protein HYU53_17850 [Acidobacteria bacterium]|nr:hypothetical protein [Acidobacteriota bacterium]
MNGRAWREPWGIAELFIVSQTALPAILYLPGTQDIRLSLRMGAFVIPLVLLAWWLLRRGESEHEESHPVVPWAIGIVALVALMFLHPMTTSVQGGLAHLALYVAIISPLFWAPALVRTPTRLRRVMALLLICNGINSLVGVLQVYDPARWLPDQFSRIVTQSELGLGPVSYLGPNGETIVRPPGLFDTPGAVAGPGMYAALLGLIFAATRFKVWQRVACLGLAFAGLAAIYLSQVRISIVVAAAMMIVYFAVLVVQRRFSTATLFGATSGLALAGALIFTVLLAGAEISNRFATLFEDDPLTVYYVARGGQLHYALNDTLVEFPFGAGLARWGMSAVYFGHATLDTPPLWAEIQLAGWIIDGGVLLMLTYCGALVVTALAELRVATQAREPMLAACGAAVFAANLAPMALIFTFTPFVTQVGVQYWFLAGALHGVVQGTRKGVPGAEAAETNLFGDAK